MFDAADVTSLSLFSLLPIVQYMHATLYSQTRRDAMIGEIINYEITTFKLHELAMK